MLTKNKWSTTLSLGGDSLEWIQIYHSENHNLLEWVEIKDEIHVQNRWLDTH